MPLILKGARRVLYGLAGISALPFLALVSIWQQRAFGESAHLRLLAVETITLVLLGIATVLLVTGKRHKGLVLLWSASALVLGYFAYFVHPATHADRVTARLLESERWLEDHQRHQRFGTYEERLNSTHDDTYEVYVPPDPADQAAVELSAFRTELQARRLEHQADLLRRRRGLDDPTESWLLLGTAVIFTLLAIVSAIDPSVDVGHEESPE